MKFINNNFAVIGQIQPSDIIELKKHNFSVIVNNRPDNEATNQPLSKEIEEIAKQKILDFCASGNRASMIYMMANQK